ncbi:hypothetical protein NQZ68_013979 [Dissostichus eleginoides]|nr:hypothetical protein NQZ68_013979 [Dissostichus eleginoides]
MSGHCDGAIFWGRKSGGLGEDRRATVNYAGAGGLGMATREKPQHEQRLPTGKIAPMVLPLSLDPFCRALVALQGCVKRSEASHWSPTHLILHNKKLLEKTMLFVFLWHEEHA